MVPAWNFVVQLQANDYVELYWSTENVNIVIEYAGATGTAGATGFKPAIPSSIVTVTQVAYAITGATGIRGASGVQGASGSTGPQGASGVNGASGTIGVNGASGVQGASGSTGPTGATGLTGASGPTILPQNSQSTTYTLALTDSGQHIYVTSTTTITIPANSSVAFPIGTTISVITNSTATATIAINSDTLYLGGVGTTGSRTLSPYGMVTMLKVASTVWYISGAGLA